MAAKKQNKQEAQNREIAARERSGFSTTLGLLLLSKGVERIGEHVIEKPAAKKPASKRGEVGPKHVGREALKDAYRKYVAGCDRAAETVVERLVAAAYSAYAESKQKPLPRERWEATKAGQAAIESASSQNVSVQVQSFREFAQEDGHGHPGRIAPKPRLDVYGNPAHYHEKWTGKHIITQQQARDGGKVAPAKKAAKAAAEGGKKGKKAA